MMSILKPEVKAKWIAALRSGEYKQISNYLKTAKGHCCLGVLSELYMNSSEEKECSWSKRIDNVFVFEELNSYRNAISFPAWSVNEWAVQNINAEIRSGFYIVQGVFDRNSKVVSLVDLNDEGCTFDQIADVIEYFF